MSIRKPTIKERIIQKFNDIIGEAPLDSYSRKLEAKYNAEVAAVTVPANLDEL
jgi:hypothetical protein